MKKWAILFEQKFAGYTPTIKAVFVKAEFGKIARIVVIESGEVRLKHSGLLFNSRKEAQHRLKWSDETAEYYDELI